MKEYHAKKIKMLELVGTTCKVCGASENLQIDHIDPASKSFNIAKFWGRKWEFLLPELLKCQTLCKDHHLEKSISNKELGGGQNRLTDADHGSVWGYTGPRKCRCELCKSAKREYEKKRLSKKS